MLYSAGFLNSGPLKNVLVLVFQGTLAPAKYFNHCVNIYDGQKYTPLLHTFAKKFVHIHLLKIALSIPMEHYNHCWYHLHDSILTPLTLSQTYLLHGASAIFSHSFIIYQDYQSYIYHTVLPWGKTKYQLHKSLNYYLRSLLGSS